MVERGLTLYCKELVGPAVCKPGLSQLFETSQDYFLVSYMIDDSD